MSSNTTNETQIATIMAEHILTTSNGVVIDPGTVAHTKGSYGQLIASTAHDIRAIILAIGSNKNTAPGIGRRLLDLYIGKNTAPGICRWLLDLAIGAAAFEQIVIPNMLIIGSTDMPQPFFTDPIPCVIPAGTRLAARAQCNITDVTDRKFTISAYGIG